MSSRFEDTWIDVSLPLSEAAPVWPGDPRLEISRVKAIAKGDPANLSKLTMSAHAGTHVDAPLHFIDGAPTTAEVPLSVWNGRARVIDFGDAPEISADSLHREQLLEGERVLLRTRNSRTPWWREPFREDFVGLTLSAAELLAERRVRCVGIDYLSIGSMQSDGAAIHRTLLGAGVGIIEGLVLDAVPAGEVELLCLPLRIMGVEGAPVRAFARVGR